VPRFSRQQKAENIVVLDVRKVSSVTDFFVIATGTSQPHLRAVVEEISSNLRDEYDLRPTRTDGATGGNWVVLDYFDVIVHVMHSETRKHYDLEGLWGDARPVSPAKARKPAAARKPKAKAKSKISKPRPAPSRWADFAN